MYKRCVLQIILLFVCLLNTYQGNSQTKYSILFDSAYSSSITNRNYTGALVLLYKAKTLNGYDTVNKSQLFFWFGFNYERLNKLDSGLYYYGEAIKYFGKSNDTSQLAYMNHRLGMNELINTKRYDKALHYFETEISILKNEETITSKLWAYYEIGQAEYFQKKYNESNTTYTTVLQNDKCDSSLKIFLYMGLANNFAALKNFDEAIKYHKKSILGLQIKNDTINLFSAFLNMGDGYFKQEKYNESIDCYKKCLSFLNSKTVLENKKILFGNLADVYEKLGNYKNAILYRNIESNLKDSISLQGISNATAEMETKYEVRLNQDSLQISTQNLALEVSKRKEGNRNLIIALSILGAVAASSIFAFRNVYLRKKANKLLTAQKEQVEKLANDLGEANQTKARLFSTISHDLRSPITTLYSFIKLQEIKGGQQNVIPQKMSEQTIHLLDTLEDLLIWSKSQMDRFELFSTQNNVHYLYKEIAEFYGVMATSKNITINNTAKENTEIICDVNILKTMLRNALANAISHAPANSSITLAASETTTTTQCLVKNKCNPEDFLAFQNSFKNAGVQSGTHGFGLVLIKEFAQKINASVDLLYENEEAIVRILVPKIILKKL